MSAPPSLPPHQLSEGDGTRTIDIAGWSITATTKPIVTASESDALQKSLGFPLPEMTFGSNSLVLKHNSSGWAYAFTTEHALKCVKNGELVAGDGGVKVGYADAWLKSRTNPDSSTPMPKTVPTKPYDWTYTSAYSGHCSSNPDSASTASADPNEPSHTIPLAELTRPDPILFYAEIPLFEDELHDNGSSHFVVRIRVMPQCIFILSRWVLRVDNVLFRTFDTRIYHSFVNSPSCIIKECGGWEAPYDKVKQFLPGKHDLSSLTDANFISKSLAQLPKSIAQGSGAGTGWRALGTTTHIIHLHSPGVQGPEP